MDLLIAFCVFVGCMVAALISGTSMILALLAGLAAFAAVGLHRGYPLRKLCGMGIRGARESLIVIEVMCVIGFITAAWRVSGTITIFVYYGIKIITPSAFLIITFLLSCLLSYALGTSFGVAGTVGVIFMTLARSGGVDPLITAGVLMSGVYFGDRGSPVSSSANMVAGITGTKIFDNVRVMMRTAAVPLALCFVVYAVLSVRNPISHVDNALVSEFESAFNLSLWAFVPAVIMLLLPLLHVSVMISMGLSIAAGILVAWQVQGVPLLKVLQICVIGYQAEGNGLGRILNGGGLVSMLEIIGILLISCTYSGIFNGTGMLDSLQLRLERACTRIGRFPVMLLLSLASAVVFCNQTISTLMCSDLLKKPYLDGGGSREELAIDMENSVILIACFIPWSIGCSVPLAFFGVDFRCLPYAAFMYLMPLFSLFTKKRTFPERQKPETLTQMG
ncbi:MAG: hypothetical protein MSS48_05820 [Clostridiales bacterium]|nr:hypothetical protein [Clostridiales bacterium]